MTVTDPDARATAARVQSDDVPLGVTSWFVRRAGLARCTTIASAAGLALAAAAPDSGSLAVIGLSAALGGLLGGHVLGRVAPRARAALPMVIVSVLLIGLTAGLLVGTVRIAWLLPDELQSRIGREVTAEVVVTGPVTGNAGWQSATAEVTHLGIDAAGGGSEAGAGERVLLEAEPPADGRQAATIFQGARLSVRGMLAEPRGPSASGHDQAKTLRRQGILVVLKVDSPSGIVVLGRRGGVAGAFDRLREAAKDHLSRGPDARINEVLQGVIMGDTVGIDDGWMEAFRRSGTAHMLSVSGLHVACLAAIMISIAGFARLSRRAGLVLAAVAGLLMIPFVGPSPPIIRAAAMMVVVLGGRLVGRRRDQWQGLAVAALVVLAINPFAVFDVGFQLSFSAFAGMIGLVRPLERVFRRLPEAVGASLAVSVAASLGTAPVSLVVFGRTSLISPLANLLVVPTLGAVTGLGMASVILGFAWSGLSLALDTLASVPMMWAVLVSTFCARAPVLGAEYLGMVLGGSIAAALALPAGLALCGDQVVQAFGGRILGTARLAAWLRGRRPRDRRWAAVLACVVVLSAGALGAAAYPAGAAGVRTAEYLLGDKGWPAQAEVRVLDVGQGTAVLVRTPDHHAALFDAGPAGSGLAGQLRSLGVKRLDLVVISHPHADHFAGLLEAADSVEVGMLVDRTQVSTGTGAGSSDSAGRGTTAASARYSSGGSEARQYLELRALLAEKGCRIVQAVDGASLSFYGVAVKFHAPSRPLTLTDSEEPWGEGRSPPTGDELNAGSIVVALVAGTARFVLPGDAEASVLERYRLPPTDVLVVGHHGSRGAVSKALLDVLRPELAVIPVGEDNSFGHPNEETLAILADAEETVLRTDRSGWVCLQERDGALSVFTERTEAP